MDTNVFVAQIKSDDIYHSEALQIERKMVSGHIRAETSVLTLVETATVAGRLFNELKKKTGHRRISRVEVVIEKEEGKITAEEQEQRLFVIRTLQKLVSLNIGFINIEGDTRSSIVKEVQTNLPEIFNETILLSFLIPLRTFDLMHVAAAKYAKEMNSELSSFVTGDNELLAENNRTKVSKITGMSVLSPREFVESPAFRA